MRDIPHNSHWEQMYEDGNGDHAAFEPYPVARAGEWFLNSLGVSREIQSGLTTLAGASGVIAGVVSMLVLFGSAGSPSAISLGLVASVLLVAIVGSLLAATAFYALRQSADFAEIEACPTEVKAAASISIIAGVLIAVCVALGAAAVFVGFLIVKAAARD